MAFSTKLIKTRIKSVGNIKKITKAMEMVAAAKMRRAVEAAINTRTYAELALEILFNISKEQDISHPLLKEGKSKKDLVIVMASNKGLCGGYNANIARAVREFIQTSKREIEFISIGKKAETIIKRAKKIALASFVEFSNNPTLEELTGLLHLVIGEFEKQNYAKVHLIYTDFVSTVKYEVVARPLLPIKKNEVKESIDKIGRVEKEHKVEIKPNQYLFEPNSKDILKEVLPRLTEVQIYQALLESIASEHSARMIAMKSASDSADEMLDNLTLTFNQARQAGITQEIAEISSGASMLN